MKAKDGVRILPDFALLRMGRVSWFGLSGAGGDCRRAMPIPPAVVSVGCRAAGMTKACSIALMVLVGGFCVPAVGGPTVDHTTAGSSGYIDLAYLVQVDPQAAETGVIEPFVRLSTNQGISQGYNTDGRRWELNENNSPQFTCISESFFDERHGSGGYLYSRFGGRYPNDAGLEEWAVRAGKPPLRIPAPGAVMLAGIGVCVVGWLRMRGTF